MNATAFAEVFYPAIPDLREAVVLAGDVAATQEARLTAANAFAELLGELWSAAEEAGAHITELLALIDGFVSGLPHCDADQNDGIMIALQVIALLDAHLAAPNEPEMIAALLEAASAEVFDPPLSEATLALWRGEESCQLAVGSFQNQPPLFSDDDQPIDECALTTDNRQLSADALELLAILSAAADDSCQDFLHHLSKIAQAQQVSARAAAIAACQDILSRFTEASADAGFAAFAALCAGLGQQLSIQSPLAAWPELLLENLTHLPQRMQDYLADPLAESPRRALVATLTCAHWTQPLVANCAAELAEALYQDPLALESEIVPLRATQVADADLALTPAEDIEASVFAGFCREGVDLTQRLASVMQVILGGGIIDDALQQAQRYAHTLKGSANVCGVRAVAVLGHYLEDVLEFLADNALAPNPALGETLVAAADGLAAMFDVINGIEYHDAATFRPLMQQVLDWVCRIEQDGAMALEYAAPPPFQHDISLFPPAINSEPVTLSDAVETPQQTTIAHDVDETYLQIPARAIDDLLRLMGELALALAQSEEQLKQIQRTQTEVDDVELHNLRQVNELEKLVDLRGLGSETTGAELAFDPLELEHYDEMSITTRRLNEGVNDARQLARTVANHVSGLEELSQQQFKLSQEIRQLTMDTRRVPVHTIIGRLQRTVRQTCRATNKEATLEIRGDTVRIDGEVLNRLIPALMHILRNAIDHGIESPAQRQAIGKPQQGQLVISFQQLGDQIEVTFSDDGAGLDIERIRAKAIASGLITANTELTPNELILFTLRPGFSTREQVTQISGRGVGMDVVANTIHALNGILTITSERGHGYQLCARLPSSLLTIRCLLIDCNDAPLALPINDVRFAVLAAEGEIIAHGNDWQFHYHDAVYPLLHLNTLMGLPAPLEMTKGVVLVMQADHGDHAVLVDLLIDSRELVVKTLGALVPFIPGVINASILGDGRVVPIVELRALLRLTTRTDCIVNSLETATAQIKLPTILIVDDSLSMRQLLAQLVTDSGYRALTARDGMDALNTLRKETIDVLLVDMEMPQMNGLELTTHLRARPEMRNLPIAMITSRSTERHRREALQAGVNHYFVKPYHDEAVLDFIQHALNNVQITTTHHIDF